LFLLIKVVKTFIGERDVPAISSKFSHVAGFRLATLTSTQQHAVLNTNLQNKVYTTVLLAKCRVKNFIFFCNKTISQTVLLKRHLDFQGNF